MRRACTELELISDGDKITVGVSGGKDSVALLAALAAYRRFSPERYELRAVTVDMGLGADYAPIAEYCGSIDVPYTVERTDIGDVIFNVRKEKSPCSLCSKMRRGALGGAMKKLESDKLALGHHADDLAETFLLSLFYLRGRRGGACTRSAASGSDQSLPRGQTHKAPVRKRFDTPSKPRYPHRARKDDIRDNPPRTQQLMGKEIE